MAQLCRPFGGCGCCGCEADVFERWCLEEDQRKLRCDGRGAQADLRSVGSESTETSVAIVDVAPQQDDTFAAVLVHTSIVRKHPAPRLDRTQCRNIEKKLRQIAALEAKGLGALDEDQLKKVAQREDLENSLAVWTSSLASEATSDEVLLRKFEKKLRQIASLEARGLDGLDMDQLKKLAQRPALERCLAVAKSKLSSEYSH